MARAHDPARRPDPVAVALAGLAALVVASGCVLWWSATAGITGVDRTGTVDVRAAQAAQDIRYLDEVLTHSAARYAATGDPLWRARYDDAVARLDAAIATSRTLGGADATLPLDAVDDANQRLIAWETEVFRLGSEGRLAQAQSLLVGEYDVQKARYGAGLTEFVARQQAAADEARNAQRRTLVVNRVVTAVLVLVLLASVVGLWRVYRSRSALVRDQARRLAGQATTDMLTGLPNRREAMRVLGRLTGEAVDGRAYTVMFVDLDGFKAVNDTFGHLAGDRVLVEAGRRLSQVAGDAGFVARLGGDEFLLVVERGPEAADALARQCLDRLAEPFTVGSAVTRLSASIGVVAARPGDAEELLQDADFAAVHAKDHGKSQVCRFDVGMRQRMIDRHRLEGELRSALAAGRLEVHYQPIVRSLPAAAGAGALHQVIGAEALVRWRLEDGSLIPPAEFIPVAESSWLIVEIDRLVLGQACAQLAAWEAAGLDIGLAVNVSGRHVIHGDLAADVRAAVARHGIEPSRLTVELTETAVLSDVDRAAAVLAEVRQLGVQVVLDDFTTGYSTLTHLTTLPADGIKIDRSYVGALDGAREHLLVEYLLRLAALAGLHVVAEGVETTEQLAALDSLGCRVAQGFLFTPALAAPDFLDWVRRHEVPGAPEIPSPRSTGRTSPVARAT